MSYRNTILIVVILGIFLAFTENANLPPPDYPQNYFRSPINTPIKLSGTFGELRSNHLHAGIDIKADNGKTGQAIYAVAEGYIARIKIQSGGYGKVLYINHPNGYTSVYAHLANFPNAVEKYVQAAQWRKESFEIELFPPKGKFTFQKGEQIGKMGLSGRSYGAHLHFEIRDTKTEKPINPLLFGLQVKDHLAPKLHELKIYALNEKLETLHSNSYKLKKSGKKYRIAQDTLYIGAWRIGLALKAYDHMSLAPNWNGVYQMTLVEEDTPVYGFQMITFPFRESRYINAHLDYEEQVSKKSYYNRLFQLPGNKLSIYTDNVEQGVITLSKTKAKKLSLLVKDVEGNESSLTFWVKRKEVSPPPARHYNYVFPYQQANGFENESLKVQMSKGTLYENLYLNYYSLANRSEDIYSSVHHLHDYKTPVHKYYQLAIKSDGIPPALKDKAFIAYCQPDETIISCGGKWEGEWLQTKVRDLGEFSVRIDQTPPSIKPLDFQKDMRGKRTLSFKVKDNYGTASNVKAISYKAYIDEKWVLLEYDAKNDKLTHIFRDKLSKGEHIFRLEVKDSRNNVSVFEEVFRR